MPAMTIADAPRERRQVRDARDVPRSRHEQEVVAVGVRLDECEARVERVMRRVYFRQNASRCQPKRRTQARGSALNVPTNSALNSVPFQPLCSRLFTGNRSGTISTDENAAEQRRGTRAIE